MTKKQQEQFNDMKKKSKCPHLNCLVYHPDGVCGCDMARWCSECKGEFAPVSDEGKALNTRFNAIKENQNLMNNGKIFDSTPPESKGLKGELDDVVVYKPGEALPTTPETPSRNESWDKEFFMRFGADKIWVTPSRDNVETTLDIWKFIDSLLASQKAEWVGKMEEINKMWLSLNLSSDNKENWDDELSKFGIFMYTVIKLLKE